MNISAKQALLIAVLLLVPLQQAARAQSAGGPGNGAHRRHVFHVASTRWRRSRQFSNRGMSISPFPGLQRSLGMAAFLPRQRRDWPATLARSTQDW
jgi:hypothetical protein